MTDNRLCSFAVYYLHHCVPHAQIVILDGTSGGVLWEVTLWATPNSPRPASIHTANGYSIFVFWGLKNDGNASVSASLLPKETSDAICPKTLIPVKMLVFSRSPVTDGSTCCILSIPKFSSRRPVLQVTLSNLKVIFFFLWSLAFLQRSHNYVYDPHVLKSCAFVLFLPSPQPRCWSVDATLPTSCWWVLGRREPTALFCSASGSWSRMSLKVTCSVSERAEVRRPARTLKRPSTVCASVICKKSCEAEKPKCAL